MIVQVRNMPRGKRLFGSVRVAWNVNSMLLKMYRVSCLAILANLHIHKIVVPEACFHADLIGTSPIIIAHKTVKLLKFLQVHSQCNCTIHV